MPLLRSILLATSRNRRLRFFAEHSALGARLSARFVAGMEIEDALRVAQERNAQGMAVTLDSLGERVRSEAEAQGAAETYHRLLDAIAERQLNANISVKPTQMGLGISVGLTESILSALTAHAAQVGNFVRVDMEDSTTTEATLALVRKLHARPELKDAIGVVIQAYLYRSESDLIQLLQEGVRVRLCKGAYLEPASVAFQHKTEVDTNYVKLSCMLLSSGLYPGLATHDTVMIRIAKDYAKRFDIPPERFEFQMLYGVRRELQADLVHEGFRVRVYTPFGRAWYPYFIRRLAERPANLLFLAKNYLRD